MSRNEETRFSKEEIMEDILFVGWLTICRDLILDAVLNSVAVEVLGAIKGGRLVGYWVTMGNDLLTTECLWRSMPKLVCDKGVTSDLQGGNTRC